MSRVTAEALQYSNCNAVHFSCALFDSATLDLFILNKPALLSDARTEVRHGKVLENGNDSGNSKWECKMKIKNGNAKWKRENGNEKVRFNSQ